MANILIIGGVRSGKSDFALRLAQKTGVPVLFVATACAGDDEMKQRIALHRRSRPAGWRTLEATTGIGPQISEHMGAARVVLVDCITLLVSNVMGQHDEDVAAAIVEAAVESEIEALVKCMRQITATFVLVSNEVGMGVVPESRLGRLYRDLLGRANQTLAESCDEIYLMVAGIPVRLKPASGTGV